MKIEYTNTDGEEYSEETKEPVFQYDEILYAGSVATLTDDNKVKVEYVDSGDVEGHEYYECSSAEFTTKEGFAIDKITINDEELTADQPILVLENVNAKVTYKEIPVTPKPNNESGATGSAVTSSSATSDNMGLVVIGLIIVAISSAGVLVLRRRNN